jgi:hypothetical protein
MHIPNPNPSAHIALGVALEFALGTALDFACGAGEPLMIHPDNTS